jgi:hypothetical protein
MKYNIYINQKAVIDNGWDLNINHLAILDCIAGMINSNMFQKMIEDSQEWYWVSPSKIIEELPLLNVKENRVRQLLNDLESCKLIEKNKNNQTYSRTFLKLGANYRLLTFAENNTPYQNISKVDKKLTSTLSKNCQVPYQNIDNNNSHYNNNHYNNNNRDNFSENEFSDSSFEKNESFDSESKQQKDQKSDSGSSAAPTKKLQSQVEPGTNEIIDVYSEWFEFQNSIPPKLSIASRKAAKEIAVYVRSVITQKTADVKEDFVKEKTREFMERMFKKWGDLEPFLQNQTKLEQINSNINNIVKQLSNGKANNSGSKSRQYSISQEEINRIAENVARKHAARQGDR